MEETGAVKSRAQPDEQSRKPKGQVVGGAGKSRLTRCCGGEAGRWGDRVQGVSAMGKCEEPGSG